MGQNAPWSLRKGKSDRKRDWRRLSRKETTPEQMQAETVKQIRERRGLPPVPPKPEEFFEAE
jgi:hypothetical protein